MKLCKICLTLVFVIGLAQPTFSATNLFFDEDFEGFTTGQTFGQINTIQNLFGDPIPLAGGVVVEHSGNKLLKMQGTNPNISIDMGIEVDLTDRYINSVSLNFFFEFVEATQNALFVPTSLTGEFFLLEAGKLTQSLFVMNFNFTGLQDDLIDVDDTQLDGSEPFSLANLATYTADLSISESFLLDGFDSVFLVLSVLYPDFADPYDTVGYFDNVQFAGTPVPEPGTIALVLIGMLYLKRRIKK